jgi:hypothetical protein
VCAVADGVTCEAMTSGAEAEDELSRSLEDLSGAPRPLSRSDSVVSWPNKDSGVASEVPSEPSSHHHHHHHVSTKQPCFVPAPSLEPKEATISQHYYPEGGWGWIVVVVGVLVQMLSHGIHLSAGILALEMTRRFKSPTSLIDTGKFLIFLSIRSNYSCLKGSYRNISY